MLDGLLEKVVGDPDGSGRYAYLPGYHVGGKTGTSETLDAKEDGEVTKRVSSFMAVAPANDPKVCVLVILDEPHMQNVYGSVIAAPVAGAILSDILPYLGVEPQYTAEELAQFEIETPSVEGRLLHDAISEINMIGLTYKVIGDGVNVLRQIPSSGETCPRGPP
jgi:stage V sporulation protein D (sporulation-specific penicillin-binding protein)